MFGDKSVVPFDPRKHDNSVRMRMSLLMENLLTEVCFLRLNFRLSYPPNRSIFNRRRCP